MEYGGKPELILDVDFGKLGLWNGFGAVVHGAYTYGRTPAGAGGTILPTNTAMTFPYKNEDGGDLTSVFLRQRFGRLAVLSVGKINMIDAYASGRELSGGRGIETFQNIEFVAPASGIVPPAGWSALGGLSGTSPIPGRGGDRFGVAAFYLGVSDDLKDGLRPVRLGDECGGEVFYNLAVTPWFRVTVDLQVISPALGDSPVVLLGWRRTAEVLSPAHRLGGASACADDGGMARSTSSTGSGELANGVNHENNSDDDWSPVGAMFIGPTATGEHLRIIQTGIGSSSS